MVTIANRLDVDCDCDCLGPSLPNSETVFVFDPEQKPKTISRSLPYEIWF
jgi:hypothetical protein